MEEEESGKMTMYRWHNFKQSHFLEIYSPFSQTLKSVMSFTYSIQCPSQFGSVHNEPPSTATMGPQLTQHSRPTFV